MPSNMKIIRVTACLFLLFCDRKNHEPSKQGTKKLEMVKKDKKNKQPPHRRLTVKNTSNKEESTIYWVLLNVAVVVRCTTRSSSSSSAKLTENKQRSRPLSLRLVSYDRRNFYDCAVPEANTVKGKPHNPQKELFPKVDPFPKSTIDPRQRQNNKTKQNCISTPGKKNSSI